MLLVRNYVDPAGAPWQVIYYARRTRVEVRRDATRADVEAALIEALKLTLWGRRYRPTDRPRWRVRRGRWTP